MICALIPGSFDPVTAGHMDLISRASRLVDKLYVGVFCNAKKTATFSTAQRVAFLQKACADLPNVEIISDDGMVVDFARAHGISILIKGVRGEVDVTYEIEMARVNNAMAPEVETLFLPAAPAFAQVSSTLVRQMIAEGRPLTGLVPPEIESDLSATR